MAIPTANRSFCCSITVLCLVLIQTQKAPSLIIAHMKNHQNSHRNPRPMYQSNQTSCALFVGNWVHDDSYPLYQYSSCPAIDPRFNCQLYGRPDSGYLKYRWRPANCELPRFNGLDFVTRMRGRTVMFVGDSLGRNQWESLICMISAGVPQSKTQMNGGETFSSFQFLDYGVTISYYKAPYLVDIDAEGSKNVLKLDEISKNGNTWRDADVLSFNTGHWWSHIGSLQGWDYIESGGSMYQDMDRLVAMERGLRTWARWVDANVDTGRTRVFFQSISPTHNSPSESNVGSSTKNCYGETTPTSSSATYYSGEYTDQMQVVETVLKEMNSPAYLLDVTMLSAMRKDAHPSIYSGDLSADQRANPGHSSDCSHWCLPGLPDTWNQLLYTALFF